MNTFLAAATAGLAWMVVEWLRDGKPTNLGAASGIVAGLVAITPAAGYVRGPAPMVIGLLAGIACCYAVTVKTKAGYDDAMDVVGVHFVGGLLGSLLIGFFADPEFFDLPFKEGLFYGGGASLLGEQLLANLVAIVWSFALTFGIMKALDATIGVRVSDDVEESGLDLAEHAETAYHAGTATMERA
jgi:Amt family ammonium transporter